MIPEIIGKTFGNLVVVAKDLDNATNKTKWVCVCSCGNTVSVRYSSGKYSNEQAQERADKA